MAEDKTITDLDDGGEARESDLFAVDREGVTLKVVLPHMGNLYVTSPTNLTIPLIPASTSVFTINNLKALKVASGSLTLSVRINGVAVTGLSNISVTSTPQSVTATALNTVAVDDEVSVAISNVSSAVGLQFTMS